MTLPVDLVAGPSGYDARFTCLGEGELVIGLAREVDGRSWAALGAAAVLLVGLLLLRRPAGVPGLFAAAVLTASAAVAVWWPAGARCAEGAFLAVWPLLLVYLIVAGERRRIARRAARAAAAAAVCVLLLPASLQAGAPARRAPAKAAPVVAPYEGDPTRADEAAKVLIPYRRYVELWNLAHPEGRIDLPPGPVEAALAGVRYVGTVAGERMNVVLTARVKTFGRKWVSLPMPMAGLAVQSATFAGRQAGLKVGPKGMVLVLPAPAEGELKIEAVTTPKYQGRRGAVRLTLPPLPGAVMTVVLPADDLVLEAPGTEGVLSGSPAGAGKALAWTFGLGATTDLTLRWSPKVGAGAADRTLSAAAGHDLHAFHWALVGVSRIVYTFSAGQHERFALLLPAGATLTDLAGANLRDQRVAGATTIDGTAFRVVEVRLHRPATKRYELTARWVAKLPALDAPAKLVLPRAADVGRESGSVVLHAADGMAVKVVDVAGGRRIAAAPANPPAGEAALQVARFDWPYRPFALTVQLSRSDARAKVRLDQLVRVGRREVQLLVHAHLAAERGRCFGAGFALPTGYEVLSAVGPAVEGHYEQAVPGGRRLHVSFRSGVARTSVALVLVRKDADLENFDVPKLTALDADGSAAADQSGRLAVQVAAALEAQTAAVKGLTSIAPARLAGWLAPEQVRLVQFAYEYERPDCSLKLKVRRQPTRLRAEVFGALTVMPASAWYSYRLRYTIEAAPIDRVRFTLPSRFAPLVAVRSPSLRSVTRAAAAGDGGRTEWTVNLVDEVTGLLDVVVNFAVPIDAATAGLDVPRLSTPAPEGYRGIVAVQNASRHELGLAGSDRLEALAVSEQEKLLPAQVRQSLQFVFQSFTDDWSLKLALKPAKAAARVQAIVDLMALTTVIDPAGRCRCEATLTIQNRREQFLRLRLPAGLRLWSALVAGQPVKPATDCAAGAGIVLIPLVKTSPGGLPYEVKLYLAGTADGKLGPAAELSPLAIRVEGMSVEHVTWSLRLPAGWRYYVRSAGNLSPITAGVEGKIAAVDTMLRQLGRFQESYAIRDMEVSGLRDPAVRNRDVLSRQIQSQIRSNLKSIEEGRYQIDRNDYDRLKQKLDQQANLQTKLDTTWQQDEEDSRARRDKNVNWELNNTTVNPGRSYLHDGATLNAMPGFVHSAAAGQEMQIATELKMTNGSAITVAGGTINIAYGQGARDGQTGGGKLQLGGQEILAGDVDAAAAANVSGVLDKLAEEQKRVQVLRQKELKDQLAQVADNRATRYFQTNGREGKPQTSLGLPPAQPGPGWDGPVGGAGAGGGGALAQPAAQPARRGRPVAVLEDTGLADLPVQTGEQALAGGTFSLPVSLPAGDVVKEFHGPYNKADGPRVVLLAVRADLADNAHSTGVLAAVVLIAFLVWMLVRQVRRRRAVGFVPAYVALAAVMVLTGGVVAGLVWAGLTVGLVELLRRLTARRRAAEA